MVELTPSWSSLIDLVEGNEAPTSCRVVEGKPRFLPEPIPAGAKPNPEPLVEVLRSEVALPREIRNWLADLFSAEASCTYRLEFKRRTGRGRPRASRFHNWEAVEHFHTLPETMPRKQALFETCNKFGIERSSLEKAIADRAAAEEAVDKET